MTVRIVTDSTCDLPAAVASSLGVYVIPLYIRVGERDYLDGVDMTREEFYKALPHFESYPITAVPSPQKFRDIYEALAGEGASEVLSIHISSSLSGVVPVAQVAAVETTFVQVTVFDSQQLSLGTGFLVQTAARLAGEGRTVAEIISVLEDQIKRTHVWALLGTLKYLRRSGRMSRFVSAIGELIQIKPILKMSKGISSLEKVRSRKKGLARLVQVLQELGPFEKIGFLHSDAYDEAEALYEQVREFLPDQETWFEVINPILGVHIGTGVVGFACVTKE